MFVIESLKKKTSKGTGTFELLYHWEIGIVEQSLIPVNPRSKPGLEIRFQFQQHKHGFNQLIKTEQL